MYLTERTVVNTLRREYKNWIAVLTDEEKFSIRKYTYNSLEDGPMPFFKRLNMMLRGEYNKADSNMLAGYAEIISHAIHKHSLQQNIICYRGMDINPIKGFKIGTEFTWDQFVSTSVVRKKALKRKYLYIIKAPQGTKGAYIEELSVIPSQREFLLDSSCIYRVLSMKENVVELEVVV